MFAVNDGHNHRAFCRGTDGCACSWPIHHVNSSVVGILEATFNADEDSFAEWASRVKRAMMLLPERDDAA